MGYVTLNIYIDKSLLMYCIHAFSYATEQEDYFLENSEVEAKFQHH